MAPNAEGTEGDADRLAGQLHDATAGYERGVGADLEALEELDSFESAEAAEAAAAVLQAHIEQLRAYADEVQRLLAEAVAERDARMPPDGPPSLVDLLDDGPTAWSAPGLG